MGPASLFRLMKLLKYLKVDSDISKLQMSNPLFYKFFRDTFANDITIPTGIVSSPLEKVLLGGGSSPYFQNGSEYNIKIFDNDSIKIKEYYNEEGIIYSFLSKKYDKNKIIVDDEYSSCFMMIQKNNNIHIYEINGLDSCITQNRVRLNGSIMLKIILAFIDQIKKEKIINLISLTDEAEKICNGKLIQLSHLKFMITGYSWYMSPDYGFKPSYWNKEENKYEIDQDLIKKYSYDRERMLSMTISSSDIITITGLLIGNEKNQQIKKSLQMFKDYLKNESENIKLSKILRRYLRYEKFNERCLGFSIIIKEFFKKHQFENYIGRVYIKIDMLNHGDLTYLD